MSVLEVATSPSSSASAAARAAGGGQPVLRPSQAGQTLALVGESGSGKSTVVRALAQLLKPTSGEILLDGRPAAGAAAALRAYRHEVQLIFQDPFASLNPMHTVRHHLARPLLLRPDTSAARPLDRAVQDLLRLGQPDPARGNRSASTRTSCPAASASGSPSPGRWPPTPDVLLADEPVSMLDVSIRLEILNLLDRLKRDRNLAMLYVTHDLATARHFSAEIMVMYRGEIVERGPSDAVILQPGPPVHADPGRRRARPVRVAGRPGGRAAPAAGRPGRPRVPSGPARPRRPGRRDAGSRAGPGLPVPGPLPARDAGVRDPSPGRRHGARAPGAVLAVRPGRRERPGSRGRSPRPGGRQLTRAQQAVRRRPGPGPGSRGRISREGGGFGYTAQARVSVAPPGAMGYGVIGSPTGSGPVSLGSSPGTPAG